MEGYPPQKQSVEISDNRVQIALAQRAFPDAPTPSKALERWVNEHFAEQYRKYVEDPQHTHEPITLDDKDQVDKLLEEVRSYHSSSETVH
ncbi:MAG: hypothetical protein WAV21_01715 [Minisyncoccia bacterium]